jgi:hypothetical protein
LEDFKASEDDRRQKNENNWMANRMYHCRDLLSSETLRRPRENNEGPRTGYTDFDAPIPNNAYLPWLRGVCLTALAKTANALWPSDGNTFRLESMHPNDDNATDATYEIVKYMIRASSANRESMMTLLQAIKYDLGILYTGWRRDFGWVPTVIQDKATIKDFLTGQYFPFGKKKPPTQGYEWKLGAIDLPDVYSVSTFNFRYDPMADHRGFDGCWWAGMTYPISKQKMWEIAESGMWDVNVVRKITDDEPINDKDDVDSSEDMQNRLRKDEKLAGAESGDYYAKNYVRVRQYHTKSAVIWQLNGRHIAGKQRALGWPFHKVVWMPIEGMFSGTSVAEPLIPVQHDINQMLRLQRTQQDRAVNPDLLVDTSRFESLAEAQAVPWGTGALVFTSRNPTNSNIPAAQYLVAPSGTAPDMWAATNLQLQVAEKAAAISDNAQGAASSGGRTATETLQIASSVDARSAAITREIERVLIVEFVERLIRLVHLNVKKPLLIRIKGAKGAKFREIVPADLIFEKSPDVIPLGISSMSAKSAGFQALRDAVMMFSANPQFQQFLKVVPSMRNLFRNLGVDPDEWVTDQNLEAAALMSQDHENILLAAGIVVPIHPGDNDTEHIESIVKFTMDDEKVKMVPEANHRLFYEHLELHQQAVKSKAGGSPGLPSIPGPSAPAPGPQALQAPPGVPNMQMSGTAAGQGAPPMTDGSVA